MKEHILFIDSRFANVRKSPTEFSVVFNGENVEHKTGNTHEILGRYNNPGEVFRNVVSVELTSFTMSTSANLSANDEEHYVVMDVNELNNRVVSNVPHANGSFAILFYNNTRTGSVQLIKGQDFDQKIRTFENPLDSLSRMTFKIKPARAYGVDGMYPVHDNFDGYFTMIFKIKTNC